MVLSLCHFQLSIHYCSIIHNDIIIIILIDTINKIEQWWQLLKMTSLGLKISSMIPNVKTRTDFYILHLGVSCHFSNLLLSWSILKLFANMTYTVSILYPDNKIINRETSKNYHKTILTSNHLLIFLLSLFGLAWDFLINLFKKLYSTSDIDYWS